MPRYIHHAAVAAVALSAFASASAQCGTLFDASLVHDGRTRTYEAYVPQTPTTGTLRPLLIVLHGGGGDAPSMRTRTRQGFEAIADTDGQLVVYPNGVDHNWNDGRIGAQDTAHTENIDDVGFISSLIDVFVANYAADPKRVYVTGMSNGAMMSYRLACELTAKVAAIAPVAGTMSDGLADCAPSRPIPIVAMNGTDDPIVTWQGGPTWLGSLYIGNLEAIPQTLMRWSAMNGCDPNYSLTALPNTAFDGTRVLEAETSCAAGTRMNAYVIEGGGHTWPNGAPPTLPFEGRVSRDIDGCTVIWDFVKGQRLP